MISKKEINDLLFKVENSVKTEIETTAYNYLINYLDCGFLSGNEKEAFLLLCLDIIKNAERNVKI